MPIEIIVPRLGWSMEEGAFVAWLKEDGEFVKAGDLLFSIEGDKAIQEIESIDSGALRIAPNCPKPGDPIRVGDVLGHLLSETDAPTAAHSQSPTKQRNAAAIPPTAPIAAQAKPEPQSARPPAISPRALRLATELGLDWTQVTGSGRTGRIRERDIRAAASTSTERLFPASFSIQKSPMFLVTGGCGFIGTWVLRELLERNLGIIVLDSSERPARWKSVIGSASNRILLLKGSLLDRDLLARIFRDAHISHIIHLAALLTPACQANPWEGCQANVLGSVAVFEQARKAATPIKGFSYASSVAVFGDEPDHVTGSTEAGSHPITFYGAFKKSMELIAEQYWRQFRIPSVGIRPQVAYGPERDVGLTAGPSLAARAAALGEPFTINYTGRIGYDYVEDVAHAFVRGALETPPGAHVVDLGGEVAEVSQVIAAIAAAAPKAETMLSANGSRIPAHGPVNPHFISALYRDWKTTSLAEGILRTIQFYRDLPQSDS